MFDGSKKKMTKDQRANRTILRRTLFLMVLFGVVSFAALLIKLYTIQVSQHERYEELALQQQTRSVTVSASRGMVYDAKGNILAISATVQNVIISPKDIKENNLNIDLIASGLSQILGVDKSFIEEKAKNTASQYCIIKRKIEQDTEQKVRTFISDNKLSKGIYLEPDTRRYYPYGSLASHIIGFVGTDNNGLNGIEALYENQLKGQNGRVVTAKTGSGTEMLYKFQDYYDAVNGENVTLTIDTNIQYYLDKRLEEAIKKYDVQNGAFGIVMNPKTGAILAMSSMPDYDLNNPTTIYEQDKANELKGLSGDAYQEKLAALQLQQWRNRSISDTYEPGSVFKALTLSMALEEGVVKESDTFYCGGSAMVPGWNQPIHCSKKSGHGSQTLRKAVENSCNVAFINIGMRVGNQKFYQYLKSFGILDKTKVDLMGESNSIVWDYDNFCKNVVSLAVGSFGQTLKVTPIQLITACAACCNGGHLMQPYVVQKVAQENGNVVETHAPVEVRQVISEKTSAQVRDILESVVKEGTGKNAYVAGWRIGGKTGTSEKRDENTGNLITSFMGFAPANDPQVIVLIGLDTPSARSGYNVSGGTMAAPTAGSLLNDIMTYMKVEPQYTEEEKAAIDTTVPNFVGLSLDEAKKVVQKKGFGCRTVGEGLTVTDQIPAYGSSIPSGVDVVLYMGGKKPSESVTVPSVTGMTAEKA
ncbi:MAG: penicillin-binding transpeptidase domain-containing protein, partial [Oscillospiraceae bacterium]|nr:penicillin-binding transpeptidase domain-containing protein [Oscillospiraceae bacterium]